MRHRVRELLLAHCLEVAILGSGGERGRGWTLRRPRHAPANIQALRLATIVPITVPFFDIESTYGKQTDAYCFLTRPGLYG